MYIYSFAVDFANREMVVSVVHVLLSWQYVTGVIMS